MKGIIVVGMGVLGLPLSHRLHHDNCTEIIIIESKDFQKEVTQEIPRIPITLFFSAEKIEDIIFFPFVLPRTFYELSHTLTQERIPNLSSKDRARIRSPSQKSPFLHEDFFISTKEIVQQSNDLKFFLYQ